MIEIKMAEHTDKDGICRVHKAAVQGLCSKDYPEDIIANWLARLCPDNYTAIIEEHEIIVAREKRCIIGFSWLDIKKSEVGGFYVSPCHVRKGIASRMFKEMCRMAHMTGLKKMDVTSTITAEPFYQSCGFKKTADMKIRWADGTELDSIRMKFHIG